MVNATPVYNPNTLSSTLCGCRLLVGITQIAAPQGGSGKAAKIVLAGVSRPLHLQAIAAHDTF